MHPRPSARRALYLHCARPQRSRQHRRHEASVTSFTTAVTPGAIGATFTFSEIATRSKAKPQRQQFCARMLSRNFFTGQINTSERFENKTSESKTDRCPLYLKPCLI